MRPPSPRPAPAGARNGRTVGRSSSASPSPPSWRSGFAARSGPTPRRSSDSWLGFGNSYVNPVVEARYLETTRPDRTLGPEIYNIFDSGGYLLWRLHPEDLVMVDSRSFPYLSWFDEQRAFTEGRDVEGFVERHPADIAVIDLDKAGTWRAFLDMDDWRLAFYGPTAAVFLRDADAELLAEDDDLWAWRDDVRNATTALRAFDFAVRVGDFPTAWALLDELRGPLSRQLGDQASRQRAYDYQDAYVALNAGTYDDARRLLRASLDGVPVGPRDSLILDLLSGLEAAGEADREAIVQTLAELAAPASIDDPQRAG